MSKILVIVLFLGIFISPALASDTIYIDPATGFQKQDGSLAFPFKSWDKIQFEGSQTYLQKRDTKAVTKGIVINKPGIYLGAYGVGKKPEIQINPTSEQAVVEISADGVSITNFIIDAGSALAAIFINGNEANEIKIKRCETRGGFNGIRITGNSYGHEIRDCIIRLSLDDGIFAKYIRSISITGNEISDVNQHWHQNRDEKFSSGDCIQIHSEDKLYFELRDNILNHSSTGNKFCFIVSGNNYSGVISGNILIGNLQGNTSAVYLHPTKNLVEISYNKIVGSAFGIYNYVGKLMVFYNIFQDNEIAFSSRVTGKSVFYNNVFDNNLKVFENDLADRIVAYNNIFIPAPQSPCLFRQEKNLTSDYNCFYVQQLKFILPGVAVSDYFDNGMAGKHSFEGNPGFAFPCTADYKLSSQSPCIDKGRNVKISRDFRGNTVPVNGVTDIGTQEYEKK